MSEGVRYCWRCDAPITKEWPGTSVVKVSMSAGGAVIWIHKECPKPPAFVIRIPR
ncbi:hypothetical protein [Streptomyces sp. NPDC003032]